MNMQYTEEQIKAWHTEFQQIRIYKEKLEFYDQHFGLVDSEYPPFNAQLDFFFLQEGINTLTELFERERRQSLPLEKVFVFDQQRYHFNITPLNSYPEVFNDFIIAHFLQNDLVFRQSIDALPPTAAIHPQQMARQQKLANRKISQVADILHSNTETSFRVKFMTVFYEGYADYTQNRLKKFSKRKKILELYLYSYGIQFGKYLEALNMFTTDPETEKVLPEEGYESIECASQLRLMQDLGIIEFLQGRFADADLPATRQQIATLLCRIMGKGREQTAAIAQFLQLYSTNSATNC
jgi:hypothetical protein